MNNKRVLGLKMRCNGKIYTEMGVEEFIKLPKQVRRHMQRWGEFKDINI